MLRAGVRVGKKMSRTRMLANVNSKTCDRYLWYQGLRHANRGHREPFVPSADDKGAGSF